MPFKVIVTENAFFDTEDGMYWYDNHRKGLGRKFLAEVTSCLKLLSENPFSCTKLYNDIRKINTSRFPYSLFYIIEGETVTVFAVIHNSSDESAWKQRINVD
jgi:plasmid stabilization system protein ParE